MLHPLIIQGGMGVGVSNWRLARAVSMAGQLGVVSGTALDLVLARRLQLGDPGGHMRRALEHFPNRSWAEEILEQYFIAGGKDAQQPFQGIPFHTLNPGAALVRLVVAANFVEVFLAKEGHDGRVGINYLEKIQLPTLPSLYGAMLAGVDYVLMGAGIPRSIPGILDRLAKHEPVELKIDVQAGLADEEFFSRLDPSAFQLEDRVMKRPKFLAIVSSAVLAIALARKSSGRVDGFVVEGPTAGGHNAPPRGTLHLSERGEPIYGPKDDPDLGKIRELALPFWLAGSFGNPCKLSAALRLGATGIQVGTAFAFCEESGIAPSLKQRIIEKSLSGNAEIFTDPLASPTGFPLKILRMEDSVSEPEVYRNRNRICDLGYLRHLYRKADGSVGYRCPGEPVESYLAKGGEASDTLDRKCVCNGLSATIGIGQPAEKVMVTSGDDVVNLRRYLKPGRSAYTASDVIEYLLSSNGA